MNNINITPMALFSINLNKNFDSSKKSKQVSFKASPDIFVKTANSAAAGTLKSSFVSEIVSLFKKSTEELPKGLDVNVSALSGQLLSFCKDIGGGKVLKATKTAIHKNCKNYFYISLKEIKNNEIVNAFAIDMDKLDIVKLRQKDALRLKEEDFVRVMPDDSNYEKYSKKLSEYADAIYNDKKCNDVKAHKVKSCKKPESQRITIDDLLDEDVILDVPKAITREEFESCFRPKSQLEAHVINNKAQADRAFVSNETKVKKTKPALEHISPLASKKYNLDTAAAARANVKPVIINNSLVSGHTIDMTPYGTISPYLSQALGNMEQTLEKIIDLLNKNRGNIAKIIKLKSDYEPIYYVKNKQKALNFRLPDNNLLGVIHTNTSKRFSRIIFKDAKEGETHFLIENRSRIASNLNKKNPWIVPSKFRYMTKEQIEASNIDKYIEFLNKEVSRYYLYLKENL